jgi:3-methyladenine DNA glycosylase AlkC
MASGFSLKDDLFNPRTVGYLADLFAAKDPSFSADRFRREVLAAFPSLELKERITHIATVLANYLPKDFDAAADRILAALPPPLDPTRTDDDFGNFIFAPVGEYVATHGLERHRARSLALLCDLTQRFSMEYAIRPFLNRWPDETLQVLSDWTAHPHYHVRRLVSEGTRPRLPWGKKISIGPERTIPLLDRLHADATRFVTRSVANHLNDIAKSDADLVLSTLGRWRAEGRQGKAELDWMASHALRTLVKDGHSGALAFLGLSPDDGVRATRLTVEPKRLPIGSVLTFAVELVADREMRAVVDYVIDFARPGGKTARKVFKLRVVELPAGRPVSLGKRRTMKGDATTFTLHPGPHRLSVQVNGRILAEAAFELTLP